MTLKDGFIVDVSKLTRRGATNQPSATPARIAMTAAMKCSFAGVHRVIGVQTKSLSDFSLRLRMNPRQRPTLPPTCAGSTIGGSRLNFRVRNGNGCDPAPMATGKLVRLGARALRRNLVSGVPPEASYAASKAGRPRAFCCKEQNSFDELKILQSIVCLTTYPADPAK